MLHIAWELGGKNLQAYVDSKLIVCQVRGEYEIKHKNLILYHQTIIEIAEEFENVYFGHIPRRHNAHADAQTSLTAYKALPVGESEEVLLIPCR